MSKTIVFTLCSNNYLAHAKTLGDSVKKYNPDFHFVIGLVDKLDSRINYNFFNLFEILPFDSIGFSLFDEMVGKYNVIEFNTSVKPFYFEYLFKKYGENALVYYIDPDITLFSSFEKTNQILDDHNFLITPHVLSPLIKLSPFEINILNVGVYNLGFIGIRNTPESIFFIQWWQERLKNHCFIDFKQGLFVDQKWINLITVLFKGVKVLDSPGYNLACWNFHERRIIKQGKSYYVNDLNTPLIFFHFSGFKPSDMNYISKKKIHELTLEARPDMVEIFQVYSEKIFANNYEELSKMKPLLQFGAKKYNIRQRIGNSLMFRTNKHIKNIFNL